MNLLILSIGTNPMPNYMVAKYLLMGAREEREKEKLPVPDKIMFVYSSDTKGFKESIVNLLNDPGIEPQSAFSDALVVPVNLEKKEREFDSIRRRVSEKLDELNKKESINSIHVNYTGGTKPMAVGISSAVDAFRLDDKAKIYSDLSPETFRLVLRNGDSYPVRKDMRSFVSLTIQQIYKLHTLGKPTLKQEVSKDLYSEDFIEYLIKKREKYKKNSNKYKYFYLWGKKLSDKNFKNFENALKDSLPDYVPFPSAGWKKLNKIKKFIMGEWLEEYTFSILNELKEDKECGITDLAWNVEAKIETEKGKRKFELDIVVVKGCQTFVITCTSDHTSSRCKLKAFEGIYRSEQIGGEHSRTILVCMADNYDKEGEPATNDDDKTIENIETDMSQFDAKKNFRILGSEVVKNRGEFKKQLKAILNGEA